jgi:hypothetical protein
MKNKFLIVLMIAVICGSFLLTSCGSMGGGSARRTVSNQGNFGEHIATPAKDFESRGLVFTEFSYQINQTRGTINGESFTYQALLREAQRAGGDAIINVVIDRQVDTVTSGANTIITHTYYGTALAIRYTNALATSTTTVNTNGTATSTQTSQGFIMNSGGSSGSFTSGGSAGGDDSGGGGGGGLLGGLFGR